MYFEVRFTVFWMYYATLYLTKFMLYYCVFECISQAFRTCNAEFFSLYLGLLQSVVSHCI